MDIMENKKFENLINDLKNLRRIDAPDNFEFRLQTKLQKTSSEEKLSIQKTKKLIPAFALASIIILLFIIYSPFADDYEDPFQIQPQVREDIIAYSENETNSDLSEFLNDSYIENYSDSQTNLAEQKNSDQKVSADLKSKSSYQPYQVSISKDDLNFIRPVMNDEEIKEVQMLKQKLLGKRN